MYSKVIIADDHFVVRLGTAIVLETHYKDIEINFAENYYEIDKILDLEKVNLLILDINMPGVDKSVIKKIKTKSPGIKILLFSAFRSSIILQYMAEGADGYLNKECDKAQIIEAIKALYNNGYFFSPEIAYGMVKKMNMINPKNILSQREYEIFELLVRGLGNLEITNKLGIQSGTVSTYKKRIFQKMKVGSVADLVKIHLIGGGK